MFDLCHDFDIKSFKIKKKTMTKKHKKHFDVNLHLKESDTINHQSIHELHAIYDNFGKLISLKCFEVKQYKYQKWERSKIYAS